MRRVFSRGYPCLGAVWEWAGLAWARGVGGGGEGEEEGIGEVAEGCYGRICEAVRKVDPNHLNFVDRFIGNRGIPRGVLEAMGKWVDMLSVQYFCEPNDASRRKTVEDSDG